MVPSKKPPNNPKYLHNNIHNPHQIHTNIPAHTWNTPRFRFNWDLTLKKGVALMGTYPFPTPL